MAPIDPSDLQPVLDEMVTDDFLLVYLRKGATQPQDEVVFYSYNGSGQGIPMTGAAFQNFLDGWLLVYPIPLTYDPETGMIVRDGNGDPVPSMTTMEWLREWTCHTLDAASMRGLVDIAAGAIPDPMPDPVL